jgi:2-polyprenyl-6-hydroxyphenyl methylase/3-demethylubiquinone-9 3-methyltransferase
VNIQGTKDDSAYHWPDAGHNCSHPYLLPAVLRALRGFAWSGERRVFDLGCGNGAAASTLGDQGYRVTGVDPSAEGIAHANRAYPKLDLQQGSAYDDLSARFGTFPVVVSLEVVEHLYDPPTYAATLFKLLEPGGMAILSTPFHGYWKNLAIAVTNKFDNHVSPLIVHGHIKFWSIPTLTTLLEGAGFRDLEFDRVGRVKPLAKSMIAIARKPR